MSIVYIYIIYLYIYIVHPQSHQDVQLVAGVTGVTRDTGLRTPMWLWFSRSTSQDSRLDVPVVFEFWILWGGGLGKSNMMIVIMIINCYYFIIVIDVLEYDDYDDFYQDHPFDFYLLELFFSDFLGVPVHSEQIEYDDIRVRHLLEMVHCHGLLPNNHLNIVLFMYIHSIFTDISCYYSLICVHVYLIVFYMN